MLTAWRRGPVMLTGIGVVFLVAGGILLYAIRDRGEEHQPGLLKLDYVAYPLGFLVVCLEAGGMVFLAKGLMPL